MDLVPRCPSCGRGALPAGVRWSPTDVLSAVALPDGHVTCAHCGHHFRVDKSTEWVDEG